MATYNVSIQVVSESEFGGISFVPSSLNFLQPGDVVNFSKSGTSSTVTVSGFLSTFWTDSSNITNSGSKTVKAGVANGTQDIVTASGAGYSRSMTLTVAQADQTPDAFGLTNKTNIDPKALILVGSFQVKGINQGVTATVSGTGSKKCYFTVNSKPAQYTSKSVSLNDRISVYAEAEYDYDEMSRTITVKVGTRTETVQVVTRKWPLPEQVINLGISSPQDLKLKQHIATFFGGSASPKLSDYLRGGGLVPSIQQNEHVPRSLPIRIQDLYDTASALYFIYKPPEKRAAVNTLDGAKTIEHLWNIIDDYNVGYGELARYLEYRYTFTSDGSELANGNGSPSDAKLQSTTGAPGTWSQNNGAVWITCNAPAYSERHYKGTLTIYCRNAIDTSLVISRTVEWSSFFYGP